MELNNHHSGYRPGDIVYVFYRNPHTQTVAHIQEAAVVKNPQRLNELALFLYETYFPLSEDIAVYQTKEAAEAAYEYYYESLSEGTLE